MPGAAGESSTAGASGDDSTSTPAQKDCTGYFSGGVIGDVTICVQTANETMIDTTPTINAHSFLVGTPDDHQAMVTFSLPQEPPPPGVYDVSNLLDFEMIVDPPSYITKLDENDPSMNKGSLTVQITGGSRAMLTGQLDAVAAPYIGIAADAEPVTVHLEFPGD